LAWLACPGTPSSSGPWRPSNHHTSRLSTPGRAWSDLYYEVVAHGGIPETAFVPMLAPLIGYTHEQVEDVAGLAMEHPFDDEYWASKRPDLTAIEVPAFVVAS